MFLDSFLPFNLLNTGSIIMDKHISTRWRYWKHHDCLQTPSGGLQLLISSLYIKGKCSVCICISNSHGDIFICSSYSCYACVSDQNKILVEAQIKLLRYLGIHPHLKNQREKIGALSSNQTGCLFQNLQIVL